MIIFGGKFGPIKCDVIYKSALSCKVNMAQGGVVNLGLTMLYVVGKFKVKSTRTL